MTQTSISEHEFDQLDEQAAAQDAESILSQLIATLRREGDAHRLFDALLLQRKHELGLPLSQPTSLQDVPAEQRRAVEETYISAVREVAEMLIAQGDLPGAWMYLQVIQAPEPLREAIDQWPLADGDPDRTESTIRLALFEQVHPVKGVQLMLQAHGTCSTITALEQVLPALPPHLRADCAKVIVRHLYDELCGSVRRGVQDRLALAPAGESLREMITGRDWLFEGGGYHVDVSHLNAVVRFARLIEPPADELELAVQLCDYGGQLDEPLQYGGDPPFADFYPSHREFFKVLLDRDRDGALAYFRRQLATESEESDRTMVAYVLVDLLKRVGRAPEAVEVASRYLTHLGPDTGFSFADLCLETGRLDLLRDATRRTGDLVGYAAALVAARGKD